MGVVVFEEEIRFSIEDPKAFDEWKAAEDCDDIGSALLKIAAFYGSDAAVGEGGVKLASRPVEYHFAVPFLNQFHLAVPMLIFMECERIFMDNLHFIIVNE